MPPRKRGASTKSTDENDSPRPSKRPKTSSAPSGKKLVDGDGNPYWELGGRLRHVTVSNFKGNYLISIREHYEKDGKILPGKKGISLSVEQFNNLLSVLPQIDSYLADNDIPLTRPIYGMLNVGYKGKSDEDEDEDEDEKKEEKVKEGEKKRVGTKEAEHDDEEKEEETEKEEVEEVKPKRKPVQKKTEPKQKKAKVTSARKGDI